MENGKTEEELFHFSSPEKGGTANGHLRGKRMFVLKNSWAAPDTVHAMPAHHWFERNRLIETGVLGPDENGVFCFLTDHEFDSPGEAACIVQGGSRNGRDSWLDAAGKSINERGLL